MEIGEVGDEADNAMTCPVRNPPLGYPVEANIKIVKRVSGGDASPVGLNKVGLLGCSDTGEWIVGRIAQNYNYLGVALDRMRSLSFVLKLLEGPLRRSMILTPSGK